MSMIPCRSILKKEKKDRPKAVLLRLLAPEAFGVEKHHEKVSKLTLVTDMAGIAPTSATNSERNTHAMPHLCHVSEVTVVCAHANLLFLLNGVRIPKENILHTVVNKQC